MQVYLIRHTTPDIEKGICYGQADIPVNVALFEAELKELRLKLPDNIQYYYSSPLIRCMQLAKRLSTMVETDRRLLELNFGEWEERAWNDIDRAELDPWMENFVDKTPPKGESYVELHDRMVAFMNELLEKDAQIVAVVTHAGVIRSFISWLLDLELDKSFRIDLTYGAVVSASISKKKNFNKLIGIQ